jgi:hypothetical protein
MADVINGANNAHCGYVQCDSVFFFRQQLLVWLAVVSGLDEKKTLAPCDRSEKGLTYAGETSHSEGSRRKGRCFSNTQTFVELGQVKAISLVSESMVGGEIESGLTLWRRALLCAAA